MRNTQQSVHQQAQTTRVLCYPLTSEMQKLLGALDSYARCVARYADQMNEYPDKRMWDIDAVVGLARNVVAIAEHIASVEDIDVTHTPHPLMTFDVVASRDAYTRICGTCRAMFQTDDCDDPIHGGPWLQSSGPCCYSGPVRVTPPRIPVKDAPPALIPWTGLPA